MTVTTSSVVDCTRDRIITAATDEFAQYGVAGARIDRIARRADSTKERLYAYFRGKQELYRFVVTRELAAMAQAAHLDPTDLPGYAGQVHDYFTTHPDQLRLMHWVRLEVTDDSAPGNPIREITRHDVEQLRRAQEAGHLDPAWDPVDVLILVHQIAVAWAWQPGLVDLVDGQVRDPAPEARRAAIVTAVQRLFPAQRGRTAARLATAVVNPAGAQPDRGVSSCAR